MRIRGVESENADAAAKIEHPPRLTTVARDVTARHIAVLDDELRIVRADDRSNRGATTAGANYLPRVCCRRLRESRKCNEREKNCETQYSSHKIPRWRSRVLTFSSRPAAMACAQESGLRTL